jgi:hypothetical protein
MLLADSKKCTISYIYYIIITINIVHVSVADRMQII